MLIISLLKLNPDIFLWKKIVSHVSGEIKIYEIHTHMFPFTQFLYNIHHRPQESTYLLVIL